MNSERKWFGCTYAEISYIKIDLLWTVMNFFIRKLYMCIGNVYQPKHHRKTVKKLNIYPDVPFRPRYSFRSSWIYFILFYFIVWTTESHLKRKLCMYNFSFSSFVSQSKILVELNKLFPVSKGKWTSCSKLMWRFS